MHCTKICSPEFEGQGQRSKVKITEDKKRKSAALCSRVVLALGRISPSVLCRWENQHMLYSFKPNSHADADETTRNVEFRRFVNLILDNR